MAVIPGAITILLVGVILSSRNAPREDDLKLPRE